MNSAFLSGGVVSAELELVECDTVPGRYPTVKRAHCLTRIPI